METKVIKTEKGRTALYTTNYQATPETPAGYPFRREVAEFIGDQVFIRQDGHYAPHYAPESSKWQLYFLRLINTEHFKKCLYDALEDDAMSLHFNELHIKVGRFLNISVSYERKNEESWPNVYWAGIDDMNHRYGSFNEDIMGDIERLMEQYLIDSERLTLKPVEDV